MKPLTVFLHIVPVIPETIEVTGKTLTLQPGLHVSIYRTRKSAEKTCEAIGGMVVETTAASLKGQIDEDVWTSEEVEPWISDGKKAETKPIASLMCGTGVLGDLPHKIVRDERGEGDQRWEFSPAHEKWLNEFYRQSGTRWNM